MTSPDLVVDVGNTRVKWGRCADGRVADTVALPADAAESWQEQVARWGLTGRLSWAVTGVHPRRRDGVADWARQRGDAVAVLDGPEALPLRVLVEHPQRVGIDRLLDAVAANSRRRPGAPAVIVDAGSAVTVDWVDGSGAFMGGAILPGLRLMTLALHEHTALLPLIDVPAGAPPLPGTSTPAAMAAGVFWAVAGGVRALVRELTAQAGCVPDVFLTGGDGPVLHAARGPDVQHWPAMTLEGIRLAVATPGGQETAPEGRCGTVSGPCQPP
jgi:type III pantothenate kinase